MDTDQLRELYNDPQLYDDQNVDVTEDLPFWAEMAHRYSKKGLPILELGTGTGRVGIPLADLGHKVVGVDLSEEMIDRARQKAADLTGQEGGDISFVVGDLRTYIHPEKSPLIFFPYNSLTHMTTNEDLDRCFQRIRDNLTPDGRFIFSVFIPLPSFLSRTPDGLYPVGSFMSSQNGETIDLHESMNYDRWSQINHITWYFFRETVPEPIIQTLNLRMYYPQDWKYILAYHGFEIEHFWGDYDMTLPSLDSVNQIIVARRKP
ncbi:MAG: class I SAM-dependent methyltransferase [Spirochaetales bacterium]|nr:class I SAM-dependent methyltransferase [Spirochaetales bacterium]